MKHFVISTFFFLFSAPFTHAQLFLPDLVLAELELPETGEVNTVVRFNFEVQNIGTGIAVEDFLVGIYLSQDDQLSEDDTRVGEVKTGNLALGRFPAVGAMGLGGISAGGYFVIIKADEEEVIEELDETNNIISGRIRLVVGGDGKLSVTCPEDFTKTENSPIENPNEEGYGIAQVILPESSTTCADGIVNFELLSPQNAIFFPYNDAPFVRGFKTHNIRYRVTDNCGNEEICEYQITITRPDLVHDFADCPADMTFQVANGEEGIFMDLPAPVFESNCPGNTNIISQPDVSNGFFFPVGSTTVSFIADNFNCEVKLCRFTVTVEETFANAPDLTIATANLPNNLQSNQAYDLSINLQNIGNESVNQLFTTTVFLSVDDNFDANDIRIGSIQAQYLAVGEYNITIPIRLLENSIGSYSIFIKTDAEETIEELREDNNLYRVPVTIDAANTLTVFCPEDIILEEESPFGEEGEGDFASVRLVVPSVFSTCELQGFEVKLLNTENFIPLLDGSYIAQGAGTYEVNYKISDQCGNEAFCSYNITIIVPEVVHQFISCPSNITISTSPNSNGAVVNYEEPIFESNCPGDTKIIIQPEDAASGSFFPIGTTEVRYIADNFNCDVELCRFTITLRSGFVVSTELKNAATDFYPNPTKEKVNIPNLASYDRYKVIDNQGSILQIESDLQQEEIDLSQLANGIYFIELEKEGKIKRIKIVKTK